MRKKASFVDHSESISPINEEILNRQFHNALQCRIHMVFQLLRSTPRTTENACARSQGGHISLFLPNLKPIISPIKRQTSKSKNTFVYIASVLFLLFCVLYASMITYQSEQAKRKVSNQIWYIFAIANANLYVLLSLSYVSYIEVSTWVSHGLSLPIFI